MYRAKALLDVVFHHSTLPLIGQHNLLDIFIWENALDPLHLLATMADLYRVVHLHVSPLCERVVGLCCSDLAEDSMSLVFGFFGGSSCFLELVTVVQLMVLHWVQHVSVFRASSSHLPFFWRLHAGVVGLWGEAAGSCSVAFRFVHVIPGVVNSYVPSVCGSSKIASFWDISFLWLAIKESRSDFASFIAKVNLFLDGGLHRPLRMESLGSIITKEVVPPIFMRLPSSHLVLRPSELILESHRFSFHVVWRAMAK